MQAQLKSVLLRIAAHGERPSFGHSHQIGIHPVRRGHDTAGWTGRRAQAAPDALIPNGMLPLPGGIDVLRADVRADSAAFPVGFSIGASVGDVLGNTGDPVYAFQSFFYCIHFLSS